jgi:hypothetical protein
MHRASRELLWKEFLLDELFEFFGTAAAPASQPASQQERGEEK